MKITQVSHLYRPSIGGIENYAARLDESLRERGHETSVITTDRSLAKQGITDEGRGEAAYCNTLFSPFRNPFSIALYRRIRAESADVYHVHSPWYLSTLEAVSAIPADVPVVMTIHGFQPIQSTAARLLDRAYKPFAQYVLDRVDRTIVLGRSERARLLAEYDLGPESVAVVPNGIHYDRYDRPRSSVDAFSRRYGLDPATPTILFVSRLVGLKNPHVLIDALGSLPDAETDVLVVGAGESAYAKNVRRQADGRVQFLQNLSFDELKEAYLAADLFAFLSAAEGLPTVVLEAMNARLPLVSTTPGALSDVLVGGEHGRTIDLPPDPRTVASAISYYLDRPDERAATGERNRAYVRRNFAWEDVATRIEGIYDEVLTSRRRDLSGVAKRYDPR